MAVRQYIGARYVPKFVGVWNINTSYEPLSIVQDANGNSYTSKQKVPAGIQLSNTTYWIMTANLNAQIEQLSDEIDAIQEDVNNNATDIAALRGVVRVGKNIVFIGDSWTYGTGATLATRKFSSVCAAKLGLTEYNYGRGQAGFTVANNTFISLVEEANTQMTAAEKANTSFVVILGGVNDIRNMGSTTESDYANAVAACVARAVAVFPNAVIVLAQATQKRFTTASYIQWTWIDSADRLVMERLTTNRVKILHHIGKVLFGTSYYLDDELHPNAAGHQMLGGFLANFILGGTDDFSLFIGPFATWNSVVASEGLKAYMYKDNDNVIITRGSITLASPATSNIMIGAYNFAFPDSYMYFPAYSNNRICGNIVISAEGQIYFAPIDTAGEGVTAVRWDQHMFRYFTPAT